MPFIDKLGKTKNIILSSASLKDDNASITGFVGYTKDLSDFQDIEDYAKGLNILLRDTGEIAKVRGFELNLQTRKFSFTPQTFRIHDLPVGDPFSVEEGIKYYHPESQPIITDSVNQAIISKY